MGQSYLDAFKLDTLHLKNIYALANFFKEAVKYNSNNVNALFQLAVASDSYYEDKKIALNHYQKFIGRFENKNKKLTSYADSRVKAIRKQYFIKCEIVE